MIQVCSFNFQHFYEFVILMIQTIDTMNKFLICYRLIPPSVIWIFIGYKAHDLKDLLTITFDKGSRKLTDSCGEHIRIQVSIDIVNRVGQDSRRDGIYT